MAAVNFHGYWGYVAELNGNTVLFHFDCLRSGCFTARSTGAVRVGDRVNWRRNTTMELLGASTVTEVMNASLLRFDGDISRYGAELVAEFPETANAGWSVRDSHFFDVYQRLFVQSGPGEVVNNSFTRMGSSISIRSTVMSRNEGGQPRGIIVANNTFSNVSLTPGGGGVSSSPVTIGRLGESPVVNYSDIFPFATVQHTPEGTSISMPAPGWRITSSRAEILAACLALHLPHPVHIKSDNLAFVQTARRILFGFYDHYLHNHLGSLPFSCAHQTLLHDPCYVD